MATYIVISANHPLDREVERVVEPSDRYKAAQGVWFIRSPRTTTSEVVNDLGIRIGQRSGIVVAATHYDGVANRELVEKLSSWDKP